MIELLMLLLGGGYYFVQKQNAIDKYWNTSSMPEEEPLAVGKMYFAAHPSELKTFIDGTPEEQGDKILEILALAEKEMKTNKPSWYTPMKQYNTME